MKDEIGKLSNNRELALKRLMNLKKNLKHNRKFCNDYVEFMRNMVNKGYAEMVQTHVKADEIWYIPHLGVHHPKKPEKIRVVYDI